MGMSEVQICNLALFRVGHSLRIDSLTEGSTEANLCKELYPFMRDFLLERHPWKFATRRTPLQLVNGDAPTNWLYLYQMPNDCAKARYLVYEGLRIPRSDQRIPYEVVENSVNGGLAIATNLPDAELCYTGRITATGLFSAHFANTLAWMIAGELIAPLSKDVKYIPVVRDQLRIALSDAAAFDLEQDEEGPPPESEFIAVRS